MRKKLFQADLFETSEKLNNRERIAELDNLIKKALKKNNYSEAKRLTEEQRTLLNKLMNKYGG